MTQPGDAGGGSGDNERQPWSVVGTSRFDRDLARLPPRVAAAIVEFVTTVLPQNPARMTKPLTGDLEGYRSARRGDYRVIVRLDPDAHVPVLHRAAHRAHAYRPT